MKARFVLAAAVLTFLASPIGVQAQGVIGGAQEGARVGNRAAGPVGGAVGAVGGGVVGGVVGGVRGAIGAPTRSGVRRAGYSRKSAKARRAARRR